MDDFSLMGWNRIAQGNALGIDSRQQYQALKGRNSIR
jgi:hypothetical protein